MEGPVALDERRGFGAASLEFHNRPCPRMHSYETQRCVSPRCPLSAQVLPKKPPHSRLRREPRSAPEREGKVGRNSCPELQLRDSAPPETLTDPFVLWPLKPGLEMLGDFCPLLGHPLGWAGSPTGGTGGGGEDAPARGAFPRVLIPFPVPAEPGSASCSLRESTKELPTPGKGHRGPWPALTPPFRRPEAVAAPKKRGLHPHPVSISEGLSRLREFPAGGCAFPWEGEGHLPCSERSTGKFARKSQTKTRAFLCRFPILRLEKAPKLPETRQKYPFC